MEIDDIKTIAVIGGGTMGNGITHVCAMTGYDVILVETKDEYLNRAVNTITKNLDRMVKKKKITEEDKNKTLARIRKSTNLEDIKDAQIVIEAVFENLDVKLDIFKTSWPRIHPRYRLRSWPPPPADLPMWSGCIS